MGSPDFDFRSLFILDLANNHQGDVGHALRIIEACGRVVEHTGARAALKFQLRQLGSFVHPEHQTGSSNKHIPRFLSTALTLDDYEQLSDAVCAAGLITMATPFDEESVDLLDRLKIDVTKIASCSATDWPLLERVAMDNRPVVVSTGGLSLDDVDDLVSFFEHRRVQFALMHCVAVYPTPDDQLQLGRIDVLRARYPQVTIGFSTHEAPEALGPVIAATAKGAELLERHVGIPMEKTPLNAYSSTPAQVDAWIRAAQSARSMSCTQASPSAEAAEEASLASLRRGVFASRDIADGEPVERADIYFAMPAVEGGLTAGEWTKGIVARTAIEKDAPLVPATFAMPQANPKAVLFHAIHKVKAMLNEARIALPTDFRLEFSHHYGVDRFVEVGAVLIDCVNRDYCKKLIVQLPGQRHPLHYHKRKEETFQVLSGVMEAEVERKRRTLYPGDLLVVPQGVWHSFWTDTGLVFEEISGTHYNDDSFYEDKRINAMARSERKTIVNQWGRHQM